MIINYKIILLITCMYKNMQLSSFWAQICLTIGILLTSLSLALVFNFNDIRNRFRDINFYIDVLIYIKIDDLKKQYFIPFILKYLVPMIKKIIFQVQKLIEKYQIYKMAFFIWIINDNDFQTIQSLFEKEDPDFDILLNLTTTLPLDCPKPLIGVQNSVIFGMVNLTESLVYTGHEILRTFAWSNLHFLNNKVRNSNADFCFTAAHIQPSNTHSTPLLDALNKLQLRGDGLGLNYDALSLDWKLKLLQCDEKALIAYTWNRYQWGELETIIDQCTFLQPIYKDIKQQILMNFLPVIGDLTSKHEVALRLSIETKNKMITLISHIFEYNKYTIQHKSFPLKNSPIYINAQKIDKDIQFTNPVQPSPSPLPSSHQPTLIAEDVIRFRPQVPNLIAHYYQYTPWGDRGKLLSYPLSRPRPHPLPKPASSAYEPTVESIDAVFNLNIPPLPKSPLPEMDIIIGEMLIKGIAASIAGTLGC